MVAVYGVTRFEFDPQNDMKNYTVFLADVVHGTPPWKPLFFLESWGRWAYRAIQRAAEQLSLPTTKGWDIRFIDGYPYPRLSRLPRKKRRPEDRCSEKGSNPIFRISMQFGKRAKLR